jgi:ketol-acid reductoisomerase
MKFYYDEDANLSVLEDRIVGIIGYGNQGSAQALNLRDSGITVIIGTRKDETWDLACADGFSVKPIDAVVREADVISLLIPDEVVPDVFETSIRPHLTKGKTLNFATGYNVAFRLIGLPSDVDVIMVAPRMLGEGVRERYLAKQGFPSFVAVHQDASGQAKETMLALAKGIGTTRMGVMELSMHDEAVLDLFTEQGVGPLLGRCLIAAYQVLVDAGFPPQAVLLELYVSGELSKAFQAMADVGILEQMTLHSLTSQYGSMTRSSRIDMKPYFTHLHTVLDDIRSGAFVKEWTKEKEEGYPTLNLLREGAKMLPMHKEEENLRKSLRR